MDKNKPIKNNTDIMGFLLIIIKIPQKIDIILIISKEFKLNPLVEVSKIKYIVFIIIYKYNPVKIHKVLYFGNKKINRPKY